MNGKDFVFSLDKEKLFDVFYKTYYEDNEIFNIESEKNNFKENKRDVVYKAFTKLLTELKEITPKKENDWMLLLSSYFDFEIEDNLSYKIINDVDVCIINKNEINDLGPLKEITDKAEIPKELLFQHYSLMFVSWEDLMSYELVYLPNNKEILYACCAYFLHELSWFGYDKETAEKNEAKEKEKLDEAIEESKNPENLISFNMDEWCKENGLEPPTEEEKALTKKLTDEIIVKNYNETVKIYNNYIRGNII